MKIFLFLCGLYLSSNAMAGELYRSIDSNGKVHYSDTPLPESDDVERLKLGSEPVADDSLPYETQRAKQNFPVTLYVYADCGSACKQARDLLKLRGVPYTEKLLSSQEDLDAFRSNSGGGQVPALTIGKSWLNGFLAEQWNKELDFAGYPKSLLYRSRPVSPPSVLK
jgi:glutaredoxin